MYNVADNEGSRFYSKGIKDCAKIFEIRHSEGFFKENSWNSFKLSLKNILTPWNYTIYSLSF